jgi:hypothetical protein
MIAVRARSSTTCEPLSPNVLGHPIRGRLFLADSLITASADAGMAGETGSDNARPPSSVSGTTPASMTSEDGEGHPQMA